MYNDCVVSNNLLDNTTLFLGVGTTVTINKVNGLAWTVLAIANATENALSMINDEMRHLREAVIQNRLVLDLLTAEKGGVCKMLRLFLSFLTVPLYRVFCSPMSDPWRIRWTILEPG